MFETEQDVSIWPFRSGDISVTTFLYINNLTLFIEIIIGRRSVPLAGVVQTLF